jgi:hypothetical protein
MKDFSALNFLGEMYPKSAVNVYDNHNENVCLAPFTTFWNVFFYQRILDFNFATIHDVGHPGY